MHISQRLKNRLLLFKILIIQIDIQNNIYSRTEAVY